MIQLIPVSLINGSAKKPKDEGETSEVKVESTEHSTEITTEKSDEKKEVEEKPSKEGGKKDKIKKEKKQDNKDNAATSSESSYESDVEDKEPSLVRRVTTKFFGGRRAKSPKADEKKTESISRELGEKTEKIEETEDKKDDKKEVGETSDTKPTENADATAQTEPTSGPESSTTENENKKPKSGGLFSFGRRKSNTKKDSENKENSESQEKGETEGAAIASATEATDIESTPKAEKEKEKETETAVQKKVIPEGIKSGTLQKPSGILRSFEQRYFVLTNDKKLFYYKYSSDPSNADPSSEKSIDLSSNDAKVKIGDGAKFDIETKIETKSRTYKLNADKEDRESWINAFKELGILVEEPQKESTSENKETKLEVLPDSGNENDIQKSVDNAADKAAVTADAKVSEVQESTTKATKVEEITTEGTVETVKTEITETSTS